MPKFPKLFSTDSGRIWQRMPPRLIPGTLPLPEEFIAATCLATRVLDVGCGTGSAVEELPTDAFGAWIGLDINAGAIATAKRRSKPNTNFLVHDARKPLPDIGFFDLVLLKGVLTCLPTHQEQLLVLHNATIKAKKRRVFIIADFLQNRNNPTYRHRYLAGVKAGLEKGTFCCRDNAASGPRYLAHHFEYPELIRLLTGAGLRLVWSRDVQVRTRSGNRIWGFVLIAE